MTCPHEDIRHCPLYRASHEPGAAGCDDGQLAGGGCAVDRGMSYAGQVAALRITHPRVVADAEWAADRARIVDQAARNRRAAGIH